MGRIRPDRSQVVQKRAKWANLAPFDALAAKWPQVGSQKANFAHFQALATKWLQKASFVDFGIEGAENRGALHLKSILAQSSTDFVHFGT